MGKVTALPIPPHCNTVEDALALAGRSGLKRIVILGLDGDDNEIALYAPQLKANQIFYMLHRIAQEILNNPAGVYGRGQPRDIPDGEGDGT